MTPGLEQSISTERLAPYLTSCGNDPIRAFRLYAWNLRISASFFPLVAAGEVSLRNLAGKRLVLVFGPQWWSNPRFQTLLGGKGKGIVLRTMNKLKAEGKQVTNGRMVSELSFGFWANMMLPKYETHLWAPLHPHFPDLPLNIDRAALHARLQHVQNLRNRIGHHEPIFTRNLSQDYADCLGLVGWMSAEKAAWLRPHLDVMRLMRMKP